MVERFNCAAKSLQDIGFVSTIDLMSSYAGRAADLAEWLKGAAINTDRDLRLQYLAGMGLNVDAQEKIAFDLVEARQFPPGLYRRSTESLAVLRDAIENGKSSRDADPTRQQ